MHANLEGINDEFLGLFWGNKKPLYLLRVLMIEVMFFVGLMSNKDIHRQKMYAINPMAEINLTMTVRMIFYIYVMNNYSNKNKYDA